VVGVDDPRWGQAVAAVVARRAGSALAAGGVITHCRERLAGYKAPKQVVIVDTIVRLANGKPDYRWARGILAAAGA
jgi:acyl-CoA synthetase (AMP-forming)/AMP-acid ligase II